MKVIRDIGREKEKIQAAIKTHGHLAQHHYQFFLNYPRKNEEAVFLDFLDNRGILAYQNSFAWRFLTDPVASPTEKINVFLEATAYIFEKEKAQKLILEDITENFRKEIIAAPKGKNWRAVKTAYSLVWPVLNLGFWDEKLAGGQWKRLRNTRHKFFRENQVEFKPADEFSREDLRAVAIKWRDQRSDTDRVHFDQYLRLIESGFEGFDLVRIMAVNGRPAAINGGWKIPNSNNYYSCLGLYDFTHEGIGEVSYIDELNEAKQMGFEKIDLGGSSGGLLDFKKKFHPQENYRTDTFSLLPK